MMVLLTAHYFNGRDSRKHPVTLSAETGRLRVAGDGIDYLIPASKMQVSEPMGQTVRRIELTDGGHCEVMNSPALNQLLNELGHRTTTMVAWQFKWRAIAVSSVAAIAVVVATYLYLLPLVAQWTAASIPLAALSQVSSSTLATLDRNMLGPSTLGDTRRRVLEQQFQTLLQQVGDVRSFAPRLVFRHSPRLGPNAFALPDGTVVLLDELADLLSDEEVIAVLSHEIGHVVARDGMRQLIQGSIVGLITTWYIGDVSGLAASLPAALLNARYSRDMESAADQFGARLLRQNQRSPSLLATALEKLQQATDHTPSFVYLSSHPLNDARIAKLRQDDAHVSAPSGR